MSRPTQSCPQCYSNIKLCQCESLLNFDPSASLFKYGQYSSSGYAQQDHFELNPCASGVTHESPYPVGFTVQTGTGAWPEANEFADSDRGITNGNSGGVDLTFTEFHADDHPSTCNLLSNYDSQNFTTADVLSTQYSSTFDEQPFDIQDSSDSASSSATLDLTQASDSVGQFPCPQCEKTFRTEQKLK